MGNEEDVGEVVQQALTQVWRHRETLSQHPNPTAWMLRITINAAYGLIRQRNARPVQTLPLNYPGQNAAPDSAIQERETRRRLMVEIARLSPHQAQAVLLRLVEALPYDAIAAALGCNERTARVHVKRGRDRLRQRLSDLNPYPLRSLS